MSRGDQNLVQTGRKSHIIKTNTAFTIGDSYARGLQGRIRGFSKYRINYPREYQN